MNKMSKCFYAPTGLIVIPISATAFILGPGNRHTRWIIKDNMTFYTNTKRYYDVYNDYWKILWCLQWILKDIMTFKMNTENIMTFTMNTQRYYDVKMNTERYYDVYIKYWKILWRLQWILKNIMTFTMNTERNYDVYNEYWKILWRLRWILKDNKTCKMNNLR